MDHALKLYSVLDKRAGFFSAPFGLRADVHALRSFTAEVNRKAEDNNMNRYPQDFALYRIGSFVQEDGTLIPTLDLVVEAIAVLQQEH